VSTTEPVDVEAIDLRAPGVFDDGPPYALFAAMREHAPVHRNPPGAGDEDGFWTLTSYRDIAVLNRYWPRCSSTRRGSFLVEGGIVPKDFQALLFNMMDPPAHDRHRGILQKVFTAGAISARESDVRAVIGRLIDGIVEAGRCDVVADLAVELPLTVTANMLGVPHEDRARLFHWTNQLADTAVPEAEKLQTLGEIGGYLLSLVASLREQPQDNLLSRLIHAELDGERLNDAEVMAHFIQLMNGGNESTATHSRAASWRSSSTRTSSRSCGSGPTSSRRRSRRSSAGTRRSCTRPAPRPRTSSWAAGASRRTTRSSCGTRRPTATRSSSRTRTGST
jgi:cytochrome P450